MDRLTLMRSFVGVTKSREPSAQAAPAAWGNLRIPSSPVTSPSSSGDLGVRLVNRTARDGQP